MSEHFEVYRFKSHKDGEVIIAIAITESDWSCDEIQFPLKLLDEFKRLVGQLEEVEP